MKRRVYVHVGAPKTGTTYLQNRLTASLAELAEHDVHYATKPLLTPNLFQFRAALDLLDRTDWKGPIAKSDGAWDAMARRIRRHTGTVILSHEILAGAKPKHVARLWDDLDAGGSSTELHVVYTARDLARQLPAAWQEGIKQGQRWTFAGFLERFQAEKMWFYRVFDFPSVLTTWGAALPPERIHLVTVPSQDAGVPRDELWHRFATACGFDAAWGPHEGPRANRSLGMAETQLIRRLNRRLERSQRPGGKYDSLIRMMLAESVLAERESQRVRVPPTLYPWMSERTERWIEWAEQSGVHVVGDLDDLRLPAPDPDAIWRDPDKVRPRQQLNAALDALAAMTDEAARRGDPGATLGAKVKRARDRLVGP